jgi:hypothetical protein
MALILSRQSVIHPLNILPSSLEPFPAVYFLPFCFFWKFKVSEQGFSCSFPRSTHNSLLVIVRAPSGHCSQKRRMAPLILYYWFSHSSHTFWASSMYQKLSRMVGIYYIWRKAFLELCWTNTSNGDDNIIKNTPSSVLTKACWMNIRFS